MREKLVSGDGNCQFRAVSDQLYRTENRCTEIRAAAVAQLRKHSELYEPFVPDQNFAEYVNDMSRDGTWGDHLTLQAIADAYSVRLCVLTSYKDNFVLEIQPQQNNSSKSAPTVSPRLLWLSFWAEVHYNSVYPMSAEAEGRLLKETLG